jgi:hypothetical protein
VGVGQRQRQGVGFSLWSGQLLLFVAVGGSCGSLGTWHGDPPFAHNTLCTLGHLFPCGRYHPVVVALFMISFVLFTTLTMIKLVVAVVLDNFGDAVDMDLEKEVRYTHITTVCKAALWACRQ